MNLHEFLAVSAAVFGLTATQAFADQGLPKPAADRKQITAQFDGLDADKDGYVTKAEAGKMKGLTESFDRADTNGDGKLDAGEFELLISSPRS